MIKHKKARKKPPIIDAIKIPRKKKEVKLDLACGDAKKEGFQGVDRFKTPSTDFTLNLLKFPWPRKAPFRTNSVDALHCSHFFEHVPQHLRGKFMDEVWRVLKPGMRIEIICPYWMSNRSVQDATHMWPPIDQNSFLYYDRSWRETNKLTHGFYDLKCNFSAVYNYTYFPGWESRSEEALAFARQHYMNVVADIIVSLVKIA